MVATLKAALLRRKQIQAETGYARSTLYLRIAQKLWTAPVRIGPHAVGWPAGEVEVLNAARIAGKSDDEIRALVAKLEGARATFLEHASTPHLNHAHIKHESMNRHAEASTEQIDAAGMAIVEKGGI